MGTDIHLYVEQKDADKWKLIASPLVERSYTMFAMMSDTVTELGVAPISRQRGLPIDVSEEVIEHYDHDMYFGASWLSDREVAILRDRYAEYMKNEWAAKDSDVTRDSFGIEYPNSSGEIRLVFWFDN